MTDRKQFEAMLEALINEDQESAKEIFHNIVVAKSREIYEELLSEDFDLEEEAKDKDKEESEDGDDEDKKVDEEYEEESMEASEEEEEGEEEGEDTDVGGDAGDKFVSDVEDKDSADDDMSDDEQTDRILDLEDALEELKAEFEQLMADEGEGAGDDMSDMDGMGDMGDASGDLAGAGMDDMPMSKADEEFAQFMEYVDKVALPKHGDNGAQTKSLFNKAKTNDMGGTVSNIAQTHEEKGAGTKGGLLNPSTKEENFGNVNVPGANAGKTAFKKKEPGHGAEKKGSGESADNKKSLIGGK